MELIRLYKSDFGALYKIMEESFPKDEIRAYSDQAAVCLLYTSDAADEL